VQLNELSGVILRNELKASRVRMSYHNKHKDGSGNFGFVVVFEKEGLVDVGCGIKAKNEAWFQINGNYTPEKRLYGLSFGNYSSATARIPQEWNFAQLSEYMKKYISEAKPQFNQA
jgi:hypothetical protein